MFTALHACREVTSELQERVKVMQSTYETAREQIEVARKAEKQ